MGFENIFTIHNFAPPTMNLLGNYGSDFFSGDEAFVVRAPTPRRSVNGRTYAHLPLLLPTLVLVLARYVLPTDKP